MYATIELIEEKNGLWMFTFIKSVLSDFIAKNIYKKYYTQNENFINTDRYILRYKNKWLTWKINFIYKCSINKDAIPPPFKI